MQVHKRTNYERDDSTFSAEAYSVEQYPGVAFAVYGWETQPGPDTEWDGIEKRTGNVLCVMIGDDRKFAFDPSEVHPLNEDDFCHECGQVGCTHDGRERESA